LLEVADIGAKTMGGAARMFDFKFSEIEFGLAAAHESDAGASLGESNSQAFSNSTPGTSDQRGHLLMGGQKRIVPLNEPSSFDAL
jgi:hypothetical protein